MRRQQVIMSSDLRNRFAQKCLKDRLIINRSKIKPILENLMLQYTSGKLDGIVPEKKLDSRFSGEKIRVQVSRKIKEDFEFLAWENGLVYQPHYGVRALELLMQLFLYGKIKIERE